MAIVKLSKNKTVVLIIVALLLIALIICAIYMAHLFSIPKGTNYFSMDTYCATVNSNGEIQRTDGWLSLSGGSFEDAGNGFEWWIRLWCFRLRTINTKPADKLPTDVQIFELSLKNHDGSSFEETWRKCVAYDFYTNQLYVWEDGNWYYAKENKALNKSIINLFESRIKFGGARMWRGQSIFAFEEFPEADFENATFRYNLYWTLFPKRGENPNIQWDGFKNTEINPPNSREDAVALAAKELGYDNPVAVTMYDETCGYYMVEIGNDNGNGAMQIIDNFYKPIEPIYTVVIDNMGRTVEVYENFTRGRPFLPEG